MRGVLEALLTLAWALIRVTIARAFGRPTGIRTFQEAYRADRLPALSEEERAVVTTFSGCISCGLCDVGEGERMTRSRGAYPGLMQIVLASSRSMPDFDAARLALEHVPETVLQEKEGLCPARIPFRRLARFVREKAAEAAPQP